MIVSCPSCDKKFKLADEKVAQSAVKLRCSSCQTVFEVAQTAAEKLYRVHTQAGLEKNGLNKSQVVALIADGELMQDDGIAGPDEPLTPAGDHPDFANADWSGGASANTSSNDDLEEDLFGAGGADDLFDSPDSFDNEPTSVDTSQPESSSTMDDDDLFGGGGSSDDDLFGGNDDANDDLFGSSQESDDLFDEGGQSENDDLFGESSAVATPSAATSDNDDLFGDDDDDLFGDSGDVAPVSAPPPPTNPQATSSDNLFDEEDDDLFGSSDAGTAAPEQDLFDTDAEDDDLFGDMDDSTPTPPSPAQESKDLFDDSDVFDDSTDDASDIFDDVEDDSLATPADSFAEDSQVQYDEDIEQELESSPFSFGDEEDESEVITAFESEEADDDLGLPFDLPTENPSKKNLYIALGVISLLGGIFASVYFIPTAYVDLPIVGPYVQVFHKTMDSTWYAETQFDGATKAIDSLAEVGNAKAMADAVVVAKEWRTILEKSDQLQAKVLPHLILGSLSGIIPDRTFTQLTANKGPIGSLAKVLTTDADVAIGAGAYTDAIKAIASWRKEEIETTQNLLEKIQNEGTADEQFIGHWLQAKVSADLGKPKDQLRALESALEIHKSSLITELEAAKSAWSILQEQADIDARLAAFEDMSTASPQLKTEVYIFRAQIALSRDDLTAAMRWASDAVDQDKSNLDAAALLAKVHNATGNAVSALRVMFEYESVGKDHYELQLQYGKAKRAMGKFDEAEKAFTRAREISPDRVLAPIGLAQLYADQDKSAEAKSILNELHHQHPDSVIVNQVRGKFYIENGDFEAAANALLKAQKGDPKSPETLALLGKLERYKNNLQAAENYLKQASDLDPDNKAVQLELGEVLLQRERFTQAFGIYQNLLEDSPQSPEILLAIAKIHFYQKEYKDAEDYFQEAIKNRLSLHEGYYFLSKLYVLTEQYKNAIEKAREAISYKPISEYKLQLARAYIADSKPGVALKELEAILVDAPNNPEALWRAANLTKKSGQISKSLEHLEKLRSIEPNRSEVFAVLAEIYVDQSQLKQAEQIVNQGLRKAPKSARLLNTAAQIALRNFNYNEANRYLTRAKSVEPRNAETRMLLGFYYKNGLNRMDRAETEFKRALEFGLSDDDQIRVKEEINALRYR